MKWTFNIGLFSKYRTELMGVATILIIICHIPIFGVDMPHWMNTLMSSCGFGVDMFLFLSGLGIYNSYRKRTKYKTSIVRWFMLRYLRIMCPLVILVSPFVAYHLFLGQQWVVFAIVQLSGFGPLFGNGALWFIPCILLLYFITPLVYCLIDGKRKWPYLIVLSFFCYFFAYLPPNDDILHFIVNRWPIYFLGFALADSVSKEKESSVSVFVIWPLSVYVLLYVVNHKAGTHFCLFGLQGVIMVAVFAILINAVRNIRLNALLKFFGLISLESYITNEYILRALQSVSWQIRGVDISLGNWTFYIVGTFLCVMISFIVHRLSKRILMFV